MTSEEYQKRLERAKNETFVIARTEEGFQIHSPASGGRVYQVTGSPEEPECSCPDFQHHASDPDWRCKHVLAVLHRKDSAIENGEPGEAAQEAPESRMLLKRSVSPDGKIDALSVEFSLPVKGSDPEAIEARARKILALQDAITHGFLRRNGGNGSNGDRPTTTSESANGDAIDARIVGVGGMDGKWGRRLFLTFQANGRNLRLYGAEEELKARIDDAGFAEQAEHIAEDQRFDLPCRIRTEPTEDGKYVNVVQVLPAESEPVRW